MEETSLSLRKDPAIYVSRDKAIYGTIVAALLSYKKLVGHILDWGFEMNPYEPPCCWSKMINDEQFTIVFNVDDLKLSHNEVEQVSETIATFVWIYATLDPITVHRGKLQNYLGTTMDFRT